MQPKRQGVKGQDWSKQIRSQLVIALATGLLMPGHSVVYYHSAMQHMVMHQKVNAPVETLQ